MKQFVIVIIIYLVAILLAKLLTVGLFLIFLYFKKMIQNMDEEKWSNYFKTIDIKGLLIRFFLTYILALCILSILGYSVFVALDYNYSFYLACSLMIIGSVYILLKYRKNKNSIINKLNHYNNSIFN
ncbi:ABC-type multidrug transport system fused ATPase/permease subunit [Breznakia pachnodae]|uniref:ABC-type multidrug transport system fused ATPase/permease subunit n=1 Tax=Breznakia pachnodae TaxID=265178 RepID=A0ABU0E0D9_9FIRM|nr:ABC-type multidrug transport system fused ATPase/permease subunit [Breznakia pachnodae]